MGYWAKDGSYQYDEDDIRLKEAAIREQGKSYGFYSEEREPEKTFSEKWVEQQREEVRRAQQEPQRTETTEEALDRIKNEQKAAHQEKLNQQRLAYNRAKSRYKSLSATNRLILKLSGKGINKFSTANSVEELDSLYNKKSR